MSFKPKARFTFFSLTTCGYCKVYKGEIKNSNGSITIDPNSGWETLRNDKELYDAGVEFVLYLVGPMKDPKTGKVVQYKLEDGYAGKWKGYPHLDLSVPDDPYNGIGFDGRIGGWEAAKSYPVIKKWILEKLKTKPFVDYANGKSTKVKASVSTPQQIPSRQVRTVQHQVPAPQIQQPPQQQAVRFAESQPIEQLVQSQEQPYSARTPSVFGMGTRSIKPAPIETTEARPKPSNRFMPSNYDE